MKVLRWLNLLLILGLLAGCVSSNGAGGFPFVKTATSLPSPVAYITPAPDAQAAVKAYLSALKNNDFNGMYVMLNEASRAAISAEDFAKRYSDALAAMGAFDLDFEVLSSLVNPASAEVAFRIIYHTGMIGDVQRDIPMRLSVEAGAWKVQWEDSLILPELAGGKQLAMDFNAAPARGNIYDRNGLPIVAQTDTETYAIGISPADIDLDNVFTLILEIVRLCGIKFEEIEDQIDQSGGGGYLPMCEGTAEEAGRILSVSPSGLAVTPYNPTRYYYDSGLASQVTGYLLSISPEQLNEYRRLGYRGDELVGQSGIEKSREQFLAGQQGGSLNVIDSSGQIVSRIGERPSKPADSIYLTIDKNLQFYTEEVLQGFNGAVVVLERDTGRVLAMASSPAFDPNLFEPTNPNRDRLTQLLNDINQPLVNRAAQGQYPLGSVFKVITFSAALESGLYNKDTQYDCQYDFTELTDQVRHDWTYEHCQEALAIGESCNAPDELPSGLLTLQQGLMRSCNPYFWHIGLDLFNFDRQTDIAKMARGFGLGSPTGIDQLAEASGQILDPGGPVEALNQAIGQGDVQVTPLQVANFMAAIGNGGTLYRPQVIEKIQPVEGDPISIFKPEARGTLPLRDENLEALQEAMVMVVTGTTGMQGTAQFRLRGLQVPVAGKTGTAESGSGRPHAWFAGYTLNSQNSGLPDIAIAVIVENIGEGSDYAAPIFQRVVDVYYNGTPQGILWFESTYGVLNTPTPLGGSPTRTRRP